MSHSEALLNELKGSLFEYLVARELARSKDIEGKFILSLSSDYQKLLETQDLMLRSVSASLPKLLSVWSKKTADKLLHHTNLYFTQIRLSGQYSHLKEQGECDIELASEVSTTSISLKLNKKQGMVNTKSAGVKSFYQQYFLAGDFLQERFNLLVEREHALLRDQLYELMELRGEDSWECWRQKGLSELPGEQPEAIKQSLHRYYAKLSSQLHDDLRELYQLDPARFKMGLLKLLGFSYPSLVQLICFHEGHSLQKEECEVLVIDSQMAQEELTNIHFRAARETASVEIELKNWLLQIRVKPMNKFTTTAIKINCSVKY